MLFLEWSATADGSHADDGVKTFLVRGGEMCCKRSTTPRSQQECSTRPSGSSASPSGPASWRFSAPEVLESDGLLELFDVVLEVDIVVVELVLRQIGETVDDRVELVL